MHAVRACGDDRHWSANTESLALEVPHTLALPLGVPNNEAAAGLLNEGGESLLRHISMILEE